MNDDTVARIADLERRLAETQARLELEIVRRMTTETALRSFAAVVAHAPVGVMMLDADGVIVDANPEAERLCGAPRERLIGHALEALVPGDRRRRCAILIAACARGRRVRRVERILWGIDGGSRAKPTVLLPVFDSQGIVTGMAMCEDISDLRDEGELLNKVNHELLELVRNDAQTGLWNRREYERVLVSETARAARTRQALSLLMIDVDDFKTYNDSFGHSAGDDCLAAVAGALAEVVHRPADFCARYGGEEFVVLLPGTGAEGARLLAERMRGAIARRRIAHPTSRVGGLLTVSIGIATVVPPPGYDGRALQEAADRALYAAKRGGRDRVVVRELLAPSETANQAHSVDAD